MSTPSHFVAERFRHPPFSTSGGHLVQSHSLPCMVQGLGCTLTAVNLGARCEQTGQAHARKRRSTTGGTGHTAAGAASAQAELGHASLALWLQLKQNAPAPPHTSAKRFRFTAFAQARVVRAKLGARVDEWRGGGVSVVVFACCSIWLCHCSFGWLVACVGGCVHSCGTALGRARLDNKGPRCLMLSLMIQMRVRHQLDCWRSTKAHSTFVQPLWLWMVDVGCVHAQGRIGRTPRRRLGEPILRLHRQADGLEMMRSLANVSLQLDLWHASRGRCLVESQCRPKGLSYPEHPRQRRHWHDRRASLDDGGRSRMAIGEDLVNV